ncbi:hypothetical protein [Pedobacter zeae]|uniref:Uncharacterized protein n=1 Tax=Pedobacter zeae TaxID=1737356 RepID=A0A7W6KBU8_9SPHI|nr:hypothetical protein [Pedobacter zeae]MBB4108911.1 hypothetical protein [Pedobacter zeae]GGH09078.1 hypothetical protein GCM10007422_27000 [Pedobacter zeae]
MKYCFGHLAPVEALPCSNEVGGSEAQKGKKLFVLQKHCALYKNYFNFIPWVGVSPTEIEFGNEHSVVLGGLQSRFRL